MSAGDGLFTFDGVTLSVDSVYHFATEAPVAVYNLEAGGNHNYYVSGTGVLVHNKARQMGYCPLQGNIIFAVESFTWGAAPG